MSIFRYGVTRFISGMHSTLPLAKGLMAKGWRLATLSAFFEVNDAHDKEQSTVSFLNIILQRGLVFQTMNGYWNVLRSLTSRVKT